MPGTGLSARHSGKQTDAVPALSSSYSPLGASVFPSRNREKGRLSPSPGQGGGDGICEAPAGASPPGGSAARGYFCLPSARVWEGELVQEPGLEGERARKTGSRCRVRVVSPEQPGAGSELGMQTPWMPLRRGTAPSGPLARHRPAWFELSAETEHAGGRSGRGRRGEVVTSP